MFPKPHQVLIEERPHPEPSAGEVVVRAYSTLISPGTESAVEVENSSIRTISILR